MSESLGGSRHRRADRRADPAVRALGPERRRRADHRQRDGRSQRPRRAGQRRWSRTTATCPRCAAGPTPRRRTARACGCRSTTPAGSRRAASTRQPVAPSAVRDARLLRHVREAARAHRARDRRHHRALRDGGRGRAGRPASRASRSTARTATWSRSSCRRSPTCATTRGAAIAVRRRRFPVEIVRAIRARDRRRLHVAFKLNSADFQRGGFEIGESMEVARALEARGRRSDRGVGRHLREAGDVGQRGARARASTRAREAYFLEYAQQIRAATDVPLMLTGGLRTRAPAWPTRSPRAPST